MTAPLGRKVRVKATISPVPEAAKRSSLTAQGSAVSPLAPAFTVNYTIPPTMEKLVRTKYCNRQTSEVIPKVIEYRYAIE